ncbi:hypothetical protein YC2023_016097 [Brassica napus]
METLIPAALTRKRCSSRRYYQLYIYALCTSVRFSSRAHRFHLRQEISALAGSSLRNERCQCQKSRNDESNHTRQERYGEPDTRIEPRTELPGTTRSRRLSQKTRRNTT